MGFSAIGVGADVALVRDVADGVVGNGGGDRTLGGGDEAVEVVVAKGLGKARDAVKACAEVAQAIEGEGLFLNRGSTAGGDGLYTPGRVGIGAGGGEAVAQGAFSDST